MKARNILNNQKDVTMYPERNGRQTLIIAFNYDNRLLVKIKFINNKVF